MPRFQRSFTATALLSTAMFLTGIFLVSAQIGAAPPPQQQINSGQLLLDLQALYTTKELNEGVYVGSELCLACHPSQDSWRDTRHAVALRRPDTRFSLQPSRGVVADTDRNGIDDFIQGLDFNQINSPFDRYKPNAPKLSVAGGKYFITIGALRMEVVATQGGTGIWKQRYLLKVPVRSGGIGGYSAENYVSPVQYNEATKRYVTYHPEDWYDGSRPKFNANTTAADLAQRNGRTYSKKCIGCHTTGVRSVTQTADGEWFYEAFVAPLFNPNDPSTLDYNRDGKPDLVNIGCEACHGPGSKHILAGGDPELVVNPAELNSAQANEVCGQCHVRVNSVPNGTFGWPYNDAQGRMWRPGQGKPLENFFVDASGRWPDGINSRQHHQQYFDFLESVKPGFQFHPVRCDECHSAHGNTSNRFLLRDVMVEGGVTIHVDPDNNTLCLSCHAGFGDFADLSKQDVANYEQARPKIARVVERHTNHPYYPERLMGLSRCTSCHMPAIATSAIDYDIHSHSFEAIAPEKNLRFQAQGGMPDSCSVSCHNTRVNVFGLGHDTDIGKWDATFDVRASQRLLRWFGPAGLWWNTTDSSSATFENLAVSAHPGDTAPQAESVEGDDD